MKQSLFFAFPSLPAIQADANAWKMERSVVDLAAVSWGCRFLIGLSDFPALREIFRLEEDIGVPLFPSEKDLEIARNSWRGILPSTL